MTLLWLWHRPPGGYQRGNDLWTSTKTELKNGETRWFVHCVHDIRADTRQSLNPAQLVLSNMVLHRPTAMSLRSMWQWEQQMFVVSIISGKRPHYPFMNSHWNPQCHIVRQRMWLPTHLDHRRPPTSHHPPPRSGDDLMTPHILQPTTPSKVPCRCMHWPRQTWPQPWWWMWQPNGEWWHLSPFTVVDMEIRQHNKWGGHHLDLSTDEVDYIVYNVVNPHVHLLRVSNPPNPVQTPTRTPEIPLPMERVWVCIG